MIYQDPISDTFQAVDDEIDLSGQYHDACLLMFTTTARIYRISRAGKTMLLKTPIDDSGRMLDLLKREYRLGVGLSHPNIATIYTWETVAPVGPGILMEYVDGRTLAEFIAEKPSLKARQRVFGQLLEAINYIHKHGVMHNDLKPGNIMVSRANDDVKIIDFGLADADGETTQRQLGGTPGYASPELSVRDADADMRSDIYSVGVVMHDIFGDRYRGIWRKCMYDEPQRRYRNIDSLMRAWQWRLRLPMVMVALSALLILCAVLVFETMKMESLRYEVLQYSQSSMQLADTITALRQSQTASQDSVMRINSRLTEINQEKALIDSLTGVYLGSAESVIKKYMDTAQKFRCRDEVYFIFQGYHDEMALNDSLFLRENPLLGPDIYEQYGMSMRMEGARELEALALQMPLIQDLTSDVDELMRVVPLIQSGQPWRLKSDSVR